MNTETIARRLLSDNGETDPHPALLADTMREVEYAGMADEPAAPYRHHGWTVQTFRGGQWAGKKHFKGDFAATICGLPEDDMATVALDGDRATCLRCRSIMDA